MKIFRPVKLWYKTVGVQDMCSEVVGVFTADEVIYPTSWTVLLFSLGFVVHNFQLY
jgi:hypothetical protein